MQQINLELPEVSDTEAVGARIASALPAARLIYLRGPLGAGKTTLVRGILRKLGYTGAVKSPTFTLVEPYEFPGGSLFHFDFYRIEDPGELEYLGLRDYLNGVNVCVIEWPERAGGLLPHPDVNVNMQLANHGRRVSLIAYTEAGSALLNEFR